jgi:reactive intermediate/imine deaminase
MRTVTTAVILIFSLSLLGAAQTGKQVIRTGPETKSPLSPAVKAGNFIYVSGTLATDGTGKLVGGDVKVQTKRALENIAGVLKAAGSGLQNAVSVSVYLKNISDFAAMNEAYGPFWPKEPPVRTTVGASLVMPDALVEISMVAVPNGAERRIVLPAGWMKSPSPYSYGIVSGDTLFLAGLVSRNGKDNSVIEGDMKAQTKAVMDNAGEILKTAGMSHEQVVSSRVFIADTKMFEDMNGAYRSWFPKNPPARATVRAPLVDPKYLVEITMLAVKGTREAILPPNPDGTPAQPNPNLSSAIRVGNRLYLSGMLGNTPSNKGEAKAQTAETLVRIERALKAGGFSWDNVVEGVVYLTDVKNFAAMNEAYRGVFTKDFPARATVETGLMNPDGLVEIMFTAVK